MAEAPTLAAVIDKLFKTIKRPNGQEHSLEEVARWCAAWLRQRGEGTFSKEYLRQLRLGIKSNPTKRHLEAMAAFFQVDPAIFLDSERSAEIQADLELAVAIRDAGVSALAMRAVSLTPDARKQVIEFIKSLQNEGKTQG
ncbi:XRE family transcriptional regulator [Amycolatopsis rhizosphaerae]|uniref:XRE family transcriptional regulator n=1 Tax=Amycolatopsis rhizosphaerae TaxID=2053003 RepID=A0A558DLS5_9PSEU|nr:XRE family transcriptional regulator [Amycolatopsis rhizosphaerae]TVT61962.1 XRE family transcriptional regulator [Amycolatopsis rhizosphaerae]